MLKDTWLWLPKGVINVASLKAGLTLKSGRRSTHLYIEQGELLGVPREFLSPAEIQKMGGTLEYHPGLRKSHYTSINYPAMPERDWWDVQKEALQALSRPYQNNGIISIACGKGKTALGMEHIRRRGMPALVIVPDKGSLSQWFDEATGPFGMEPFRVGIVGDGKDNWSPELTIGLLPSVLKVPDYLKDYYGVIIFDEAHHLGAAVFGQVAHLFYGERIGLTATPLRSDGFHLVYHYHIGPVLYQNLDLDLSPICIFKHTHAICPPTLTHTDAVTALSKDPHRNKMIIRELTAMMAAHRNVLVIGNRKDQLKLLYTEAAHITGAIPGLYIGETKTNERRAVRQTCNMVFGTFRTARDNLNIQRLDIIFLITPFRDQYAAQQTIGRILREYEGKGAPLLVVLEDQKVACVAVTCGRLRTYIRQQGFDCHIVMEENHEPHYRDATVGTPKAGDNDTRAHQRDTSPHLQTLGDAFRAQGIKPRDLGRIVKK